MNRSIKAQCAYEGQPGVAPRLGLRHEVTEAHHEVQSHQCDHLVEEFEIVEEG